MNNLYNSLYESLGYDGNNSDLIDIIVNISGTHDVKGTVSTKISEKIEKIEKILKSSYTSWEACVRILR